MEPYSQAIQRSENRKPPLRVFFSASIVMFFLTLSAADSVGFVPYYVDGTSPQSDRVVLSDLPELGPEPTTSAVSSTPARPDRIIISSIGLDLPVQNPSTRDIGALDTILKDGPARYVDSAHLGQKGNVLIFAHSSRLPVVRNEMFRAFNRVSELSRGDIITVTGEGRSYLYAVLSVRRGNASDEVIDLSPTQGEKLTLVTCDTLTSKDSRWIVEAEFVGTI